ncbi:hypothetical protein CASFOL_001881 [Castilleja foliolosa]|uniref:Replication factor A C-terminal domain-containing protein n=1 Tax=Castilleja foliolosa TaxID=1961234 RepID=A0ABD3ECN8_9LAMI
MTTSYSVSSNLYVNIGDLEPGRTSHGVKVRVIRCYRKPSSHKADPDGSLEMIVHDAIEDRIHATMDYSVFKQKQMEIKEGGLYKIKTFMVAEDMSQYKTTNNPLKLRLFYLTSIAPFEDNEFPTSMHKFRNLFEFANDIAVDNFQLIDIIGRVVSYQKPTFVAKVATRRMDFKIANTEGRELGCSLWGDYIAPVLSIFEKEDSSPIILCMQFGKITRVFGEIKVSNTFHVTKVTINEHSDVFKNFLDGMVGDLSGSQNHGIAEEVGDIYDLFKENLAQMRDIKTLTSMQEKNKFWVDATIAEIDPKGGFCYSSCRRCIKKMPMDERNRQCFHCGEDNFTYTYRYKIELLVGDSSGCATMMLWDAQCTTLIGKTANYMKQLSEKAGTRIPRELHESLVDKRVLFEVKTPSNRVSKDIPQFTVSRVAVDEDIFDIYAKNYTPTRGSTTDCKNQLIERGEEACSRIKKGKMKMDDDEKLENATVADEGLNLIEGNQDTGCEEEKEDEHDEVADVVTLKDLKEKKNGGSDAKYSSKNKKQKVKQDK